MLRTKPVEKKSQLVQSKPKLLSLGTNNTALAICGPHHGHLEQIERALDVEVHTQGNEARLNGDPRAVAIASSVLKGLKARVESGREVDLSDVEAIIQVLKAPGAGLSDSEININVGKRYLYPRSKTQAAYLRAIDQYQLVFAEGPAGTGKTYLAVVKAVEALLNGEVDKIILSRPAVEAGEQLGFLPGDLREKVDPYLRPLFDGLHDVLPQNQVVKLLESGEIEVAPLAFMRGRTLSNAFVVLDEAQNTTVMQMKMFLTRIGVNSTMVVTGDLSQVDLPRGTKSGLKDSMDVLKTITEIFFVSFSKKDTVRHPLISHIVNAYEVYETGQTVAARNEKKDYV